MFELGQQYYSYEIHRVIKSGILVHYIAEDDFTLELIYNATGRAVSYGSEILIDQFRDNGICFLRTYGNHHWERVK